MKYREIFKKWHYWVIAAILMVTSLLNNIYTYGNVFVAEIIGHALGALVTTTIAYTVIILVRKVFGFDKG